MAKIFDPRFVRRLVGAMALRGAPSLDVVETVSPVFSINESAGPVSTLQNATTPGPASLLVDPDKDWAFYSLGITALGQAGSATNLISIPRGCAFSLDFVVSQAGSGGNIGKFSIFDSAGGTEFATWSWTAYASGPSFRLVTPLIWHPTSNLLVLSRTTDGNLGDLRASLGVYLAGSSRTLGLL